jgi:hypothetical protein
MLFSDFTKWLDFLGYLSHRDKFNQCKWFLKPHPAFYDNETKIYKKISEKFKNIKTKMIIILLFNQIHK